MLLTPLMRPKQGRTNGGVSISPHTACNLAQARHSAPPPTFPHIPITNELHNPFHSPTVTRGWIEGAVHSMGTLYHTATTTAPPPAQLLPLRRMLCSPWIERSR